MDYHDVKLPKGNNNICLIYVIQLCMLNTELIKTVPTNKSWDLFSA